VSAFLAVYADILGLSGPAPGIIANGEAVVTRLGDGSLGISYTDYDWDLNDISR
jgi:hypothetical protein